MFGRPIADRAVFYINCINWLQKPEICDFVKSSEPAFS